MAEKLRDVMTGDLVTLSHDTPVNLAAQIMRDRGIGDVLVTENGKLRGIVTDRNIVVRAAAEDRDMADTQLSEICTADLATLAPSSDSADAVRLMRTKAIRRVPVVDRGQAVGIVTLGDMAVRHDGGSALADISKASPTQ